MAQLIYEQDLPMKNDNLKTIEHPVNHNYRFAVKIKSHARYIHVKFPFSLNSKQPTAIGVDDLHVMPRLMTFPRRMESIVLLTCFSEKNTYIEDQKIISQ